MSEALALPVESTLLDGVDVAYSKDADEAQHAPKDLGAVERDVTAIDDRPRYMKTTSISKRIKSIATT
jgi:hypothetical protein